MQHVEVRATGVVELSSLDTQTEIATAQIAFRARNDEIHLTAAQTIVGPAPFVCECANASCEETVRMTVEEYEVIRQNPRTFFNVTGHEAPSVKAKAEKIVAIVGELTIVAKIGVAGDLAADEATD